jgi:hypothetical protein
VIYHVYLTYRGSDHKSLRQLSSDMYVLRSEQASCMIGGPTSQIEQEIFVFKVEISIGPTSPTTHVLKKVSDRLTEDYLIIGYTGNQGGWSAGRVVTTI